jgi:hypothetical protein
MSHANLLLPHSQFCLPIQGKISNFLFDPNFADKRQAKYGSIFKTSTLIYATYSNLRCSAEPD